MPHIRVRSLDLLLFKRGRRFGVEIKLAASCACQASNVSGYEVVRVLVVGGALIVGFGALMLLGLLTMIRALFCESLFETP